MQIPRRSSRRPRRSTLITWGALPLLLTLAWAVPVTAAGRPATLTRGGLTVAVPRPGMGVVASALMADGTSRELNVRTTRAGTVVVVEAPDAAPAARSAQTAPGDGVAPAGALPACSDTKHAVSPSWWHTTFRWAFKSASTPSNVAVSTAERELKRAVNNITTEHNDCGRADRVSATSSYLGHTTRKPQIDSAATCYGTDGHNTVAFGSLPGGFVAYTCWWYTGTSTQEADMVLNKHVFHFAITPGNCSNAYLIQDVATHEFGHVYGLLHANPQSTHANLTMSPSVYYCDPSDETLGLGDMLGLETHY